jgi:hypothetical protein
MSRLTNPLPLFLDTRGALLDAGYVYVGAPGSDPEIEANQIALFWDAAMTDAADQPLRTLGGQIVNGSDPAFVYMAETDWSLTVKTADGALVSYLGSTAESAIAYQPLDDTLTDITEVGATTYGLGLLTLANTAALKAATGIADALPLTGGSISGNITRLGAGAHTYWSDATMTSGREFLTSAAGADPTSLPGDKWFGF